MEMNGCWFVPPGIVRLSLSDGQWLDVKKELNAGETRAIFTDLVRDFNENDGAKLDPTKVGLTKTAQYVVGWSLVDAKGLGVPFSIAALNNLYPDKYSEIIKAVETHDDVVEAARLERKNGQAPQTESAPTS